MTTEPAPRITPYSMKVPLLSAGRTNEVLARTSNSEVRAKVYAEGGENALHTHLREDHTFFVLDGQATFYDGDETPVVVEENEGMMVPAGAYYRFQSTGDRNLVILRVGAKAEAVEGSDGQPPRVGPDGEPLAGSDPRNKRLPPVFSGGTFGVD